MAWPYDERHYEFGNGVPVPSTTLNEMEDRIIDLHSDRQLVLYDATPAEEGMWTDVDREYWEVGDWDSDGGLYFNVPVIEGMAITKVEAKVYNNNGADMNISIVPFLGNAHFDVAGTAPEWYGGTLHTTEVTHGTWAILSSGDISIAITEGQRFRVKIVPGTIGDRCAGVQVTYRPLTAST